MIFAPPRLFIAHQLLYNELQLLNADVTVPINFYVLGSNKRFASIGDLAQV